MGWVVGFVFFLGGGGVNFCFQFCMLILHQWPDFLQSTWTSLVAPRIEHVGECYLHVTSMLLALELVLLWHHFWNQPSIFEKDEKNSCI